MKALSPNHWTPRKLPFCKSIYSWGVIHQQAYWSRIQKTQTQVNAVVFTRGTGETTWCGSAQLPIFWAAEAAESLNAIPQTLQAPTISHPQKNCLWVLRDRKNKKSLLLPSRCPGGLWKDQQDGKGLPKIVFTATLCPLWVSQSFGGEPANPAMKESWFFSEVTRALIH